MSDSTNSESRYWFYGIAILVAFVVIWGSSEISEAGSHKTMSSILTQINNLQQAYYSENQTYANTFAKLDADSIVSSRTYSYTLRADSTTFSCTVFDDRKSGGREQAGMLDQTGKITFFDYEEVNQAGRIVWLPVDSLLTGIDVQ